MIKISISDGYIHCEHCQTLPLHVVLCEYMIHCTQSKAMNPISNQELLCVIFYGWKFMRARIHFVSWTWLTNATSKLPFLRVCLSEARSQARVEGGVLSNDCTRHNSQHISILLSDTRLFLIVISSMVNLSLRHFETLQSLWPLAFKQVWQCITRVKRHHALPICQMSWEEPFLHEQI